MRDIRFGIRMLLNSPGFTALALIMLALGIGANTTIFSVVNAVLLRPLPYREPDRIVQIVDTREMRGNTQIMSSFPKFSLIRSQARTLESVAAIAFTNVHLSGAAAGDQGPVQVPGARVSADFFRVLGATALRGRDFRADDDLESAAPVAVISHQLWASRFAENPNAIGQQVGVDGESATVIAIMPAEFDFPSNTQIWIPKPYLSTLITRQQVEHGASFLTLIGRLSSGADLRQSQAEIETLARQYDAGHAGFVDINRGVHVTGLRQQLVQNVRPTLLVLLAAVGFVLLIASANVANLLLARAVSRGKEVAVRAALGASRGRLLLQFLTESVLLSFLGAGLGLLLASWSIQLVTRLGAGMIPRADEIRLNGEVLAFTMLVSVITGIAFGLGPAFYSLRVDLNETLKASARSMGGSMGGERFRGWMIAAEVALAMILLTGAGLLIRSFSNLIKSDPGFRTEQLLTMNLGLSPTRYAKPVERSVFYDQLMSRVAALPGVRNVTVTTSLPPNGSGIGYFFNIEGRPKLEPAKAPIALLSVVSPSYFSAMGVPLVRGRYFSESDTADSTQVLVVSETMARRFWPNEDPIGRHIIYSREQLTVEIVGVVGDVKNNGLAAATSTEEMYVPYRQRPPLSVWLVTRGAADPANLTSAIRREVLTMDPDQPIANVRSMTQVISESVTQPRLQTVLIGCFAALALILTVIGIFGMVAWSVSQRTSEIGIRLALGASPSQVVSLVIGQSYKWIGIGQIAGLAGAWALTRVLTGFLYGISPEDPMTFLGVTFLLTTAAVAACFLAARRVTQLDPVIALRGE